MVILQWQYVSILMRHTYRDRERGKDICICVCEYILVVEFHFKILWLTCQTYFIFDVFVVGNLNILPIQDKSFYSKHFELKYILLLSIFQLSCSYVHTYTYLCSIFTKHMQSCVSLSVPWGLKYAYFIQNLGFLNHETYLRIFFGIIDNK